MARVNFLKPSCIYIFKISLEGVRELVRQGNPQARVTY